MMSKEDHHLGFEIYFNCLREEKEGSLPLHDQK
jgi:hypothetical protein